MPIKKCFLFVFLMLNLFLLSSCECEPDNIVTEQYTFERQIAYIFYNTEERTNNFGGVTGHDTYLIYGVVEPDGKITEYKDCVDYCGYVESHTITVSDRDYVLYTTNKTINYTTEWSKEEVIDYDFYLTEETLKNIGGQ